MSKLLGDLQLFFQPLWDEIYNNKIKNDVTRYVKHAYCITNNIPHQDFPVDVFKPLIDRACTKCSEHILHYDCDNYVSRSEAMEYYDCQYEKLESHLNYCYSKKVLFDEPTKDTRWKKNMRKQKTKRSKKIKISKKRKNHQKFVNFEMLRE